MFPCSLHLYKKPPCCFWSHSTEPGVIFCDLVQPVSTSFKSTVCLRRWCDKVWGLVSEKLWKCLQWIMFSLCCQSVTLIYHFNVLFHPLLLFFSLQPEVNQKSQPQHAWSRTLTWIPLFFFLCLLCFTVPVSLPPHPFISSLSLCMSPLQLPLLLNMNPMQTLFCYPFHATLSVIQISQAVYLFIRMPLYENTCMQDGCFQGYHRATK